MNAENQIQDKSLYWDAVSFRFTIFPSPSYHISEQNWWAEVAGDLPENINTQPKDNVRIETGLFANGKLTLAISPIRIDWQFAVIDPSLEDFSSIQTLGMLDNEARSFQDLILNWIDNNPDLSAARIALGCVAIQPVEDRNTGYERLFSEYLTFKLVVSQSGIEG